MELQNAIIKSASISIQQDILKAWLYLDYECGGPGFGGYTLYFPNNYKNHDQTSQCAGHWIYSILKIAGVEKWEQLPGKPIRVKIGPADIYAIGHIIKDIWFHPNELPTGLK